MVICIFDHTLCGLVSVLVEIGHYCWNGGELALGILKKDFVNLIGLVKVQKRFLVELHYNFTHQSLDLFFLQRLSGPW